MQWELSASPGSISLKWFGFLVNPWLLSRGHGFVSLAWTDVAIESNGIDATAMIAAIASMVGIFIIKYVVVIDIKSYCIFH
jgi:hypothetical protein